VAPSVFTPEQAVQQRCKPVANLAEVLILRDTLIWLLQKIMANSICERRLEIDFGASGH
jgi:hypothetical protein